MNDCYSYPLRLALKAVFRTIATAAKPASAMKAINRSVVVKRDQVSIWLFVTEVTIARFRGKGKGGKPNLGKSVENERYK